MTTLRVSPKLHKTLLSECRRGADNLLSFAGYGARNDPDALVLNLSVTAKPTKSAADAARFDPVLGGHSFQF